MRSFSVLRECGCNRHSLGNAKVFRLLVLSLAVLNCSLLLMTMCLFLLMGFLPLLRDKVCTPVIVSDKNRNPSTFASKSDPKNYILII